MKKLFALVLVAVLALTMMGFAAAEESSADEETFCSVDDQGILTVTLHDDEEGFFWTYSIADTNLLEPVNEEFDTENAMYTATFRGLETAGDTALTLTYSNDDIVSQKFTVNLNIDDANMIQFTALTMYDMDPDWCETNDTDTLVVRVPENASTGYSWNVEIADESLVVVDSSESVADENSEGLLGVGGEFVIRFSCAAEATGITTITMSYVGPTGAVDDVRTIEVYVTDGIISIAEASETTPAVAEE